MEELIIEIIIVAIVGIIFIATYLDSNNKVLETKELTAVIIDKQKVKVGFSRYTYKIILRCKELTAPLRFIFEERDFDSVIIGDKINVKMVVEKNKNGVVRNQYFRKLNCDLLLCDHIVEVI